MPHPYKLIFDFLTLKVVSESRVTWATSVPILVFLYRPLCSRLMPDVHDKQTDVRRTSLLNASALRGRGHNNDHIVTQKMWPLFWALQKRSTRA